MQINSTMSYHNTPIRMAKMQKLMYKILVEQQELLFTADGNANGIVTF